MGIFWQLFHLPIIGPFLGPAIIIFSIWMIVDCVQNGRDIYWIWIILIFWGIGALIYFFYFKADLNAGSGWAKKRDTKRRIEELKSTIHHLDKADHYSDLGDAYREIGRLDDAKKAYESALE